MSSSSSITRTRSFMRWGTERDSSCEAASLTSTSSARLGRGRGLYPRRLEIGGRKGDRAHALHGQRRDDAVAVADLDLCGKADLAELLPAVEARARRGRAHHAAHLEAGLLDPKLTGRSTRAEHPAVAVAAARQLVGGRIDARRGQPAAQIALPAQHQ